MAASSRAYRGSSSVAHNVCCVLLVFSLGLCASPASLASSQVPVLEKQALLRIRQELSIYAHSSKPDDQPQMLPWDPGTDPCDGGWVGVQCICSEEQPAECKVQSLNLSATYPNLKNQEKVIYGRLPDVFSELKGLQMVDVSQQQLAGPLPEGIFTHPTLEFAYLQNNLFSGNILNANTSLSPSLGVLDVGFNMLSGPIDGRLCSLRALTLASNPSICGQIPACLDQVVQGGVSGTALLAGIGSGHECTVPTPQCTGVPLALPEPIRDSVGVSDGTQCAVYLQGTMLGMDSFNITFSSVENVDALLLKVTGVGVLYFSGWFWMDSELHALLSESVSPNQVCPPLQHSAVL